MNFFQWYQDPLTLWEKVRLFFKRTQTMIDPDFFGSPHIVKFKTLGGKIYVLDADPARLPGLSITDSIRNTQRELDSLAAQAKKYEVSPIMTHAKRKL
jgi:hypothetical protein